MRVLERLCGHYGDECYLRSGGGGWKLNWVCFEEWLITAGFVFERNIMEREGVIVGIVFEVREGF